MCLMNFSCWLEGMPNLDDYVSLRRPGADAIEFVPLPIAAFAVPLAGEHFGAGHGPLQLHAVELVAIVAKALGPSAVEPVAMVRLEFEAQALRFVEQRQRGVEQCVELERRQRGDALEQRQLVAMRRAEII